MIRSNWITAAFFFLVLLSLVFGCGPPPIVKVGTLSVIDSLPLSLGRHKPIFAENNLVVEVVSMKSAQELRSALINGRVDAIITSLVDALLLNQGEERGKIVRVARRGSLNHPMFAFVTKGPRIPENAKIAVSGEAMDKYAASRLLKAMGLARWTEVEVDSPEAGLEKMKRGEVSASLLSEPFVSFALRNGTQTSLDGGSLGIGQTVVYFNQKMVNEKPALIRRFLRAYEQSVRELNVRPEAYRFLVLETIRPPSEMIAHITIPIFPFPGEVPTESDIEAVNAWLLEKKMVSQPISYQRGVNPGFLWDPYQFKPASCCEW